MGWLPSAIACRALVVAATLAVIASTVLAALHSLLDCAVGAICGSCPRDSAARGVAPGSWECFERELEAYCSAAWAEAREAEARS
jgi:hypothetical protein